MEKVYLEELLEDYYIKGNIWIVKVKNVEAYYARAYRGEIEDSLYGLSKDMVNDIINGTFPIEEINKRPGWGTIGEYSAMLSQERLQRWKKMGDI